MEASLLIPSHTLFEAKTPEVSLRELWQYSTSLQQHQKHQELTARLKWLQSKVDALRVRLPLLSKSEQQKAQYLGVSLSDQVRLLQKQLADFPSSPVEIPEAGHMIVQYANQAILKMKVGDHYWNAATKTERILGAPIEDRDLWVISTDLPINTRPTLPRISSVTPGDAFFARHPPTKCIGAAHIRAVKVIQKVVEVTFDEEEDGPTYTLEWLSSELAPMLPGEIIKLSDAQEFVPGKVFGYAFPSNRRIWPLTMGDLTPKETLTLLDVV